MPARRRRAHRFEACCRDGFELCQQGRLGEAEARFHDALTLKPDSADVLNDLGTVLGLQSRLEEAAHYLRRAITAEPTLARRHANLAAALMGLKRLDEAEAAARAPWSSRPTTLPRTTTWGRSSRRPAARAMPKHAFARSCGGCRIIARP